MNWLDPVFTDLRILPLIPVSIELIFSEQTRGWVYLMFTTAVRTFEWVRTWLALFSFEMRGVGLHIGFTALAKFMVILQFVRSIPLDTFRPLYSVWKSWMAPSPTIFTLRNTRVGISFSYGSNEPSDIEAPVNKVLHFCTALSIPYVNLDNCHVWLGRDFNNSWLGGEGNIVEDLILLNDEFSIIGSESIL